MTDNSEQAEFWNGRMGTAWVSVEDRLDSMLEPLSSVAIERAATVSGERVIDVGCGCGSTSISLGSNGAAVWGVDISEHMIARAKEKAQGMDHVNFSVADASTQSYTNDHHCLFSRYGVMFFADPVSAFANLKTALVEDGRLVFLCWQPPTKNPWIGIPAVALQDFMPQDAPPPDPHAPGPFSFADPDYTSDVLTRAGFRNISIDPVEKEIQLGANIDEAMEFQGMIGPLSGVLESLEASRHDEAVGRVADALSAHATDRGLHFGAASWLVTASQ